MFHIYTHGQRHLQVSASCFKVLWDTLPFSSLVTQSLVEPYTNKKGSRCSFGLKSLFRVFSCLQVVPILRAGLALAEHASSVLPAMKTYHLGSSLFLISLVWNDEISLGIYKSITMTAMQPSVCTVDPKFIPFCYCYQRYISFLSFYFIQLLKYPTLDIFLIASGLSRDEETLQPNVYLNK